MVYTYQITENISVVWILKETDITNNNISILNIGYTDGKPITEEWAYFIKLQTIGHWHDVKILRLNYTKKNINFMRYTKRNIGQAVLAL